MTMIRSLLIVLIVNAVVSLICAAPYKALPKLESGPKGLPLMYVPMVRKGKPEAPAVEVHVHEARLGEAPDTGDSDSGMHSPDAIMNIVKATDFASHKHHFQRRKDPEGTPYIEHPVAVAHILTHLGKVSNPVVIISALLHDTVEDTDTTFEEIEREFGPRVRSVVEELTDNKHMTRDERKRCQILHAPHSSHEAKLVKLADKLHNLRDIERSLPVNWTEERKTQYFNWARDVVQGLRGTNAPIEAELDALFAKYCTPREGRENE
ncbi:guanosine-3',5'-bis(diphosphate) 3'-pyrophosphohydrolase MESH1 isoform X2 [Diaphorina citri]|uniref:Guanosine-3',5'-bis(diphosphate) 3'-pyrophosphohydrolase MESH1 n=1 Tax=Diaphorina citri TaxID=121845 RepID=A0A1S3DE49_DIACI|nr:guanosine-3',5'-bis(diphosphate) 3'-pyrophosphohydrolase MESH1 isoform X2 [Diaphorina citri]